MKVYSQQVYDIDLEAPPEIRWREFARAEAGTIARVVQDTEDQLQELVARASSLSAFMFKTASAGFSWLYRSMAQLIGQEYADEVLAIAKYADVPAWAVMRGNLLYDMTSRAEVYGCGCSSYSCVIDGAPVLARNMDWELPDSVGQHTRIVRFHRGQHNYISVGVPGFVGVVSAMSSRWALTVNQAPNVHANNVFRWPALQHVRRACDRAGDFYSLIDGLTAQATGVPFFAHVVGLEPHEQTVLVGTGKEYRRRKLPENQVLVQTNHYLHEDLAHFNPANRGGQIWDTYPRYAALKKRLRKSLPTSLDEALAKLRGPTLTHDGTAQQMVFCPATKGCAVRVKGR